MHVHAYKDTNTHTHTHTHIYIYIYVCVYTCMCVCRCVCVCVCVRACACVCVFPNVVYLNGVLCHYHKFFIDIASNRRNLGSKPSLKNKVKGLESDLSTCCSQEFYRRHLLNA